MNCKEMEARLVSYTDGRAGDAERRAVESHLEGCAACRARVAEFRSVWGVLDEAPALEPSPSFDARLRQRIAAEPRRSWLDWLVPSPRLALATAALTLLAVWVTVQPVDMPPPAGEGNDVAVKVDEDLQDYDMLADFDAISALTDANGGKKPAASKDQM